MLTIRRRVVEYVFELAKTQNAFDELERRVEQLTLEQMVEALLECGVIPEALSHDSSEEKLWAKYCDILLAKALTALGLNASVIGMRSNSADVLATGQGYTIVGDAKAFRLSRTAKNQKDFKVGALNIWRKQHTYSCLVGPLAQFPNMKSQIYQQAVEMNVTLISYTHLRLLITQGFISSLEPLWNVVKSLERNGSATQYWAAIDTAVTDLCGVSLSELEAAKRLELDKTRNLGNEGIEFWEDVIKRYKELSKEEAIESLIKAEKIHTKIRTIKKAISWTEL